MHIKHISGSFGVEILSFDLSKCIQQRDRDKLSKLLVDKKVLVFKDQDISPEQHREFAGVFG